MDGASEEDYRSDSSLPPESSKETLETSNAGKAEMAANDAQMEPTTNEIDESAENDAFVEKSLRSLKQQREVIDVEIVPRVQEYLKLVQEACDSGREAVIADLLYRVEKEELDQKIYNYITEYLAKLDGVESRGDVSIRKARKKLVKELFDMSDAIKQGRQKIESCLLEKQSLSNRKAELAKRMERPPDQEAEKPAVVGPPQAQDDRPGEQEAPAIEEPEPVPAPIDETPPRRPREPSANDRHHKASSKQRREAKLRRVREQQQQAQRASAQDDETMLAFGDGPQAPSAFVKKGSVRKGVPPWFLDNEHDDSAYDYKQQRSPGKPASRPHAEEQVREPDYQYTQRPEERRAPQRKAKPRRPRYNLRELDDETLQAVAQRAWQTGDFQTAETADRILQARVNEKLRQRDLQRRRRPQPMFGRSFGNPFGFW